MEAVAKMNIRQSAKKVQFVLNEVKYNSVNNALAELQFINKKASKAIYKTLMSAINNLQQLDQDVDVDNIYIKEAYVDQGPTLKRFRPAAMGRAVRILKRTSKLTIVVSDKKIKRG